MSEKTKRWTVLLSVSLVMMTGYIFWDIISPLSTQLKKPVTAGGMAWTAAEYGFYAGSYSIFNIFLLMLFFGGIILDKCGIRFTGILATGCMLMGALINYAALTLIMPASTVVVPLTLFGLIPGVVKVQVLVAALGFALFGMGCDITGITISKIVTKWFTGKELASAMGIQVALARLGTASALSLGPLVAQTWGLASPVLVGSFFLGVGFLIFLVYCVEDREFDRRSKSLNRASVASHQSQATPSHASSLSENSQIAISDNLEGLPPESAYQAEIQASVQSAQAGEEVEKEIIEAEDSDVFRFRDFMCVLRNPGFWLIALLCVTFYSSIRPFMKFATDLLVNKFQADPVTAGWVVAIIPYGTIVLTPFFGSLYDRIGRGTLLMLLGCSFVLVSHLLLALPTLTSSWVAVVVMVLIGIAFSLVPSALWPSVPKIVPLKQLGTAYSIIYFIQNLGLMLVPIWIGNVIGHHTSASGRVDFTVPMMIFTVLGALSVLAAIVLLVVDHRRHYGLEQANMRT